MQKRKKKRRDKETRNDKVNREEKERGENAEYDLLRKREEVDRSKKNLKKKWGKYKASIHTK